MNMQSPLSKAKGLGSAKEGLHHWMVQRFTGIALVPLSLWFMWSMTCLNGAEYAEVVAWLQRPANAVSMALFVGVALYHSALGVQVVMEDYIHHEGFRIIKIIGQKFVHYFLAALGVFSVLQVAFGG